MKVSTSELAGAALDWAVAKCEALPVALHNTGAIYLIDTPWTDKSRIKWLAEFSPARHWAQGGPIIEREEIHLLRIHTPPEWVASAAYRSEGGKQLVGWRKLASGPTPLIAAMRCYVVSKLGGEIDVPEELT